MTMSHDICNVDTIHANTKTARLIGPKAFQELVMIGRNQLSIFHGQVLRSAGRCHIGQNTQQYIEIVNFVSYISNMCRSFRSYTGVRSVAGLKL